VLVGVGAAVRVCWAEISAAAVDVRPVLRTDAAWVSVPATSISGGVGAAGWQAVIVRMPRNRAVMGLVFMADCLSVCGIPGENLLMGCCS
jgi:hypothetical protein